MHPACQIAASDALKLLLWFLLPIQVGRGKYSEVFEGWKVSGEEKVSHLWPLGRPLQPPPLGRLWGARFNPEIFQSAQLVFKIWRFEVRGSRGFGSVVRGAGSPAFDAVLTISRAGHRKVPQASPSTENQTRNQDSPESQGRAQCYPAARHSQGPRLKDPQVIPPDFTDTIVRCLLEGYLCLEMAQSLGAGSSPSVVLRTFACHACHSAVLCLSTWRIQTSRFCTRPSPTWTSVTTSTRSARLALTSTLCS